MNMIDYRFLELSIAQLQSLVLLAQQNKYDTYRIGNHLKELESILYCLSSFDFSSKTDAEKEEVQQILDYISYSLKYILSSTGDGVHLEVYYALRNVLEEWVPNSDIYIMVATEGNFEVNWGYATSSSHYDIIKKVTGIDVMHRLVLFKVPVNLQNDYLCNCSLYHEIGHFIDAVHNISGIVYSSFILGKICLPLTQYFAKAANGLSLSGIRSYLREYFADIFASQYLGKSSYAYINQVASTNEDTITHPATSVRISMVDNFVDGIDNPIINLFNQSTQLILGKKLSYKNLQLDLSPFFKDNQCDMSTTDNIHSIISGGWTLWFDNRDKFVDSEGKELHYSEVYNQINRNIQKSVDDYRNKRKTPNS